MNGLPESHDRVKEVTGVIKSLERGELSEDAALEKLKALTGRSVERDWLRNYWRSESPDDFAARLCAKPVENWQSLTDSEAESLISEYLKAESPGRRESIESAIDRRYKKPSGTLNELVFQKDLSDPKRILDEIKKDTTIRL